MLGRGTLILGFVVSSLNIVGRWATHTEASVLAWFFLCYSIFSAIHVLKAVFSACSQLACRLLFGFSPLMIAFIPSPIVTMMMATRYCMSCTTHFAGPHSLCSGSSRTSPAPRMKRSVLLDVGCWVSAIAVFRGWKLDSCYTETIIV
jgi:hypothetical protein